MKIGIISDSLNQDLTGIGKYTHSLINELKKISGVELCLINYKRSNLLERIDELVICNPFKKLLKTYMWYPYATIKLRDKLNLDITHNPAQVPTFFRFHQKYVITVHDLTPILFPKEHKLGKLLIYKLLFPRTLKNADKIIAVSNNTKQDLIKFLKVPEEKITVIYEAADEKYKPLDQKEISKIRRKYSTNFPFVLYVGTLEPRKNIPFLIKAFYKFKKKAPEYKLVITGKKGWKYKEIFELVGKLNLQHDVIFTGYVSDEDLPALYNAADLFVYPSLYEGFGLPPLEAMACGTPVITSNTSSLPEVVGHAGIMIDPYDVDGLASSIYEVLTNNELKADMIKKGLERAKMFSWEKCARETLNVYKEACNTVE